MVGNGMSFRAVVLSGIVALAACSGGFGGGSLPQTFAPGVADELLTPANGYYPLASPNAVHAVCPRVTRAGEMRCNAWVRTDLRPVLASDGIPSGVGYTPQEIQSAYELNPARGAGQTVAIIDAFADTTAASDLAHYRKAAKLPPCGAANGCLRILNQQGHASPLPPPNRNWQQEETLDLDAVSATCPKCHIILIEAQNDGTNNLFAAVATAARLGANVISNSYGGSEGSPAAPGQFNQPGHLNVASAGDFGGGERDGGGAQMPCSYAAVVCVGGTRLTHHGNAWSEKVWNDLKSDACGGSCGGTGSGCSAIVPKPSWQTDSGCSMRSEADVAADASVFTPFAVYSVQLKRLYGNPWQGYAGTSLAAPLIAGVFGLAGNASSRHGAQEIWASHHSLKNITVGDNVFGPVTGPCASSVHYICFAGDGFNGPTGWGTPKGSSDF